MSLCPTRPERTRPSLGGPRVRDRVCVRGGTGPCRPGGRGLGGSTIGDPRLRRQGEEEEGEEEPVVGVPMILVRRQPVRDVPVPPAVDYIVTNLRAAISPSSGNPDFRGVISAFRRRRGPVGALSARLS